MSHSVGKLTLFDYTILSYLARFLKPGTKISFKKACVSLSAVSYGSSRKTATLTTLHSNHQKKKLKKKKKCRPTPHTSGLSQRSIYHCYGQKWIVYTYELQLSKSQTLSLHAVIDAMSESEISGCFIVRTRDGNLLFLTLKETTKSRKQVQAIPKEKGALLDRRYQKAQRRDGWMSTDVFKMA